VRNSSNDEARTENPKRRTTSLREPWESQPINKDDNELEDSDKNQPSDESAVGNEANEVLKINFTIGYKVTSRRTEQIACPREFTPSGTLQTFNLRIRRPECVLQESASHFFFSNSWILKPSHCLHHKHLYQYGAPELNRWDFSSSPYCD
jgi:hypothetical protein